ncbi:MAG: RdgB/HAM1 family non-canonical purine NTP pyrophosphatase [Planctomycetales bacterium]|nr:RdgB/HAM1 family non-canonical purine NTP pyrophosphatase [Planctomycetales bacterium]
MPEQSPAPILVLGTHNKKKRLEMEALLAPIGCRLLTLDDFSNALEVDETGATFAENAALKAAEQAKHLEHWVLGEDSGLVVPALQGDPGVYSARYSGPNATDASNNALLLERLQGIADRKAYYVCAMALSDPNGEILARSEGRCWGRILTEERGAGGFGYDPMFEIPEYHHTFGQLGPAVKAAISHRARASAQMVLQLGNLIRSGGWYPDVKAVS